MGDVVLDITMSLDGYVAAPDSRLGQGLGVGGERLHYWVFGGEWTYGNESGEPVGVDREVFDEMFSAVGAVVVGRRMYDVVDGWGHENPWGVPCFVVTHRSQESLGAGPETFTAVDGIREPLDKATAAAGDKDVYIGGGANLAQQCLAAGLVDRIQIHIAPVLLGAGVRLFEHTGRLILEHTGVRQSPYATHLGYRVVRN